MRSRDKEAWYPKGFGNLIEFFDLIQLKFLLVEKILACIFDHRNLLLSNICSFSLREERVEMENLLYLAAHLCKQDFSKICLHFQQL